MFLALACALFAALGYGGASVLQGVGARGADSTPGLDPRLMVRLTASAPYLSGVALDLAAFGASLVALRSLPLFVVQAAVASSVGVTAAIAAAMGDRIGRRDIVSLIVLGAGLILMAISAEPGPGTALTPASRWGLLASVVVLGGAGAAAARRTARWSAPALAALAGLAFTVVAIAAHSLTVPSPLWHVLSDPGFWAILVLGGLGLLLFTTALQRGSVTSITALMVAVETVVPASVGLALLGDSTRPGYAVIAGLGFFLTIAGTVALATQDVTPVPVDIRDQ
ncbi:MAG: hypothetical protein ABI438_07205 [Dermatophilaceae bacterium]